MLGAPVTIGFFFKNLIFIKLVTHSYLLGVALILNLIMLVFYLQIFRYTQFLKKKNKLSNQSVLKITYTGLIFFNIINFMGLMYITPLQDIINVTSF